MSCFKNQSKKFGHDLASPCPFQMNTTEMPEKSYSIVLLSKKLLAFFNSAYHKLPPNKSCGRGERILVFEKQNCCCS